MRWVAGAVAVALCAGCASGAEPAASTASPAGAVPPTAGPSSSVAPSVPPVPGMAAEAVQLRTDAAVGGRIQVRITASEAFTVTSVALDFPGFEPVPPRELDTEFVAGRVIDLPVTYGAVRCAAADRSAVARLTVVRAGGEPEQVQVPLAAEVLGRIHDEECAAQELAEVVGIEVGGLRPDGDALAGELLVTRRSGDREVRAVRILRSVLVAVTADLPLVLTADADAASVSIRFTLATCEPHVLAETKQPFVFPLTVEAGDGRVVTLDLPLTGAVRDQLMDLVDRVCA